MGKQCSHNWYNVLITDALWECLDRWLKCHEIMKLNACYTCPKRKVHIPAQKAGIKVTSEKCARHYFLLVIILWYYTPWIHLWVRLVYTWFKRHQRWSAIHHYSLWRSSLPQTRDPHCRCAFFTPSSTMVVHPSLRAHGRIYFECVEGEGRRVEEKEWTTEGVAYLIVQILLFVRYIQFWKLPPRVITTLVP